VKSSDYSERTPVTLAAKPVAKTKGRVRTAQASHPPWPALPLSTLIGQGGAVQASDYPEHTPVKLPAKPADKPKGQVRARAVFAPTAASTPPIDTYRPKCRSSGLRLLRAHPVNLPAKPADMTRGRFALVRSSHRPRPALPLSTPIGQGGAVQASSYSERTPVKLPAKPADKTKRQVRICAVFTPAAASTPPIDTYRPKCRSSGLRLLRAHPSQAPGQTRR
jgi:hypothetical protein